MRKIPLQPGRPSSGAPAGPAGPRSFLDPGRGEAAPLHGTVVVCPGVYKASVTVDRAVNLRSKRGAVVDADGIITAGFIKAFRKQPIM